jgi:hypothetical protein
MEGNGSTQKDLQSITKKRKSHCSRKGELKWLIFGNFPSVRIWAVDGKLYEGTVICVDDVEEMCDAEEDEITIETSDGKLIGFPQSQVVKIERLK